MSVEAVIKCFQCGEISFSILKRPGVECIDLTGRDFSFQKKDGAFCPVLFETPELAENFNADLSSTWEIREVSYSLATEIFGKVYGESHLQSLLCILYTVEDDSDLAVRGRISLPFKR